MLRVCNTVEWTRLSPSVSSLPCPFLSFSSFAVNKMPVSGHLPTSHHTSVIYRRAHLTLQPSLNHLMNIKATDMLHIWERTSSFSGRRLALSNPSQSTQHLSLCLPDQRSRLQRRMCLFSSATECEALSHPRPYWLAIYSSILISQP